MRFFLLAALLLVSFASGAADDNTAVSYVSAPRATCDFKTGMCRGTGFDTYPGEKGKHLVVSHFTAGDAGPFTGPQAAHPTADTNDLNFMYFDATYDDAAEGDQEAFASPVINTHGKQVCFSMAYYMYGRHMGNLYVVEKYNEQGFDSTIRPLDPDNLLSNRNEKETLIASGGQGKRWIETSMLIGNNNPEGHVQAFIVFQRGPGRFSNIAVDSIKISDRQSDIDNCGADAAAPGIEMMEMNMGMGMAARLQSAKPEQQNTATQMSTMEAMEWGGLYAVIAMTVGMVLGIVCMLAINRTCKRDVNPELQASWVKLDKQADGQI